MIAQSGVVEEYKEVGLTITKWRVRLLSFSVTDGHTHASVNK